jgi:hypothetical protein
MQFAGFSLSMMPMPVRTRTFTPLMGAVEDAAANCLEDGCSVDTLADLIKELKVEASENVAGDPIKAQRQKQVLMMIGQLSVLSPDTQVSEIEKVVRNAARSFSVVDNFKFPGEAIGYTGKPGTTTTAGKALN